MVSISTFRHVGDNHVFLPDWLRQITGKAAVLVIACKASRKIACDLADAIVAEETLVSVFFT